MKEARALVTGASEGIGREFARQLADAGYRVTAVARNEKRLKQLASELKGSGHSWVRADLSRRGDYVRIAKVLQKTHYTLLVNNAGVGGFGRLETRKLEDMEAITSLNIDALVALSRAFLTSATKGDALINVSSMLAFVPMAAQSVYCASKAFVTSFSESLWYHNRKRGVYVMALHPGITITEFTKRAGGDEERIPKALSQTPEQVVSFALVRLKRRRKPSVISGLPNRIMFFMSRVLTRKSMVKIMSGFAE